MKGFVKLYLCYAQKRLKNAINIHVKEQNFRIFRVVRSLAKFTYIKLGPCSNNYKSFKTLDLVEAT